jgi:ABC-type nitrate/sulfonate/bicarbonate transport system substrate-binding protein
MLGTAGLSLFGASRRANATEKLSLVVGTAPPDPACHYLYYAREKGFYRANGLEVDIKGMISATNATRAAISTEADIAWPDAVSSIVARDAGAKLRVISAFARRLDYLIVGTAGIDGMKQLEGKRFASATIGGGTFVIPRALCVKAGGDPRKIQFVALGNSAARAQALIAGTIDATIVTSSFLPALLSHGNLHVIANASTDLPDFIYTWEIVNELTLRNKRPALENFVVSLGQAVQWAEANPEAAADLSASLLPDANRDEIRAGILSYIQRKYWSRDGFLPPEALGFTEAALLDAGQIKSQPAFDEFVAGDLMQAARGRLDGKSL